MRVWVWMMTTTPQKGRAEEEAERERDSRGAVRWCAHEKGGETTRVKAGGPSHLQRKKPWSVTPSTRIVCVDLPPPTEHHTHPPKPLSLLLHCLFNSFSCVKVKVKFVSLPHPNKSRSFPHSPGHVIHHTSGFLGQRRGRLGRLGL